MRLFGKIIITIFLALPGGSCQGQNEGENMQPINRKPAVAGQFYPADSLALSRQLEELFRQAQPRLSERPAALIVPHAGYVFSGKVAASAYNQVSPDETFENVFIIGPSHRASFDGASIYTDGDYLTPLGKARVNARLAKELTEHHNCFTYKPEADRYEHNIEVQVPFLQKHLKPGFQIIPIIIGTEKPQTIRDIARALQPFFVPQNLFVISTDFSHYPGFADAKETDATTADAICSGQSEKLLLTLHENSLKKIPGLVTSLCGASAVLALLYITEGMENIEIRKIDYQNSGHSSYGDNNRVVGYYAMTVTRNDHPPAFTLTENEKKTLLDIARNAIAGRLNKSTADAPLQASLTPALKTHCGAFVTLHINETLRGCIGHFGEDKPLWEVVHEMALASAFRDTRFPPLGKAEFEQIKIEISVLTPMRKINSINEIVLGRHGIYIKKGWQSGTFLPQVAIQTGWNLEAFLGHCSRDKAGLGWEGWKNAEIFIYEAFIFSESAH
jgi:hypothetical protein